jgi:hypothetical protein
VIKLWVIKVLITAQPTFGRNQFGSKGVGIDFLKPFEISRFQALPHMSSAISILQPSAARRNTFIDSTMTTS